MKHSLTPFNPGILNQDTLKKLLCTMALILITLMHATSAHAYNAYYAQPYQTQENPVITIQNALDKLKSFGANTNNINPLLLRSTGTTMC